MRATSPNQVLLISSWVLASIGCASGTTSGTSTTTTQPTQTTPVVPTGWVNLDRPYVSFDYPSGWKLLEVTSATAPSVDVADPAQPTNSQVLVQFVPGYPNKSNNGDQCADADQYLTDVYNNTFFPMATDPTKYPRTTVTWLYLPSAGGRLGGAGGTISISYQANVASAVNYLIEVQAVPRTGGLYLVIIYNPDYYASPSFEKTFLSTLVLKYPFLAKGSNCSYLN